MLEDELGRAAPDVEHDHVAGSRREIGGGAPIGELALLHAREDLRSHAGDGGGPLEELGAVGGVSSC